MSTENILIDNDWKDISNKGDILVENRIGSSIIEIAGSRSSGTPPADNLIGHRIRPGMFRTFIFKEGRIYARTLKEDAVGLIVVTSRGVITS